MARAAAFDTVYEGSIPSPGTKYLQCGRAWFTIKNMLKLLLVIVLLLLAIKPALAVYKCVDVDTTPGRWGKCIVGELR